MEFCFVNLFNWLSKLVELDSALQGNCSVQGKVGVVAGEGLVIMVRLCISGRDLFRRNSRLSFFSIFPSSFISPRSLLLRRLELVKDFLLFSSGEPTRCLHFPFVFFGSVDEEREVVLVAAPRPPLGRGKLENMSVCSLAADVGRGSLSTPSMASGDTSFSGEVVAPPSRLLLRLSEDGERG